MKHILIAFSLIFFTSLNTKAQLNIYGGKNHNVFLGCLTCNTEDPNSIWSPYGDYGIVHSKYSIWDAEGKYGSKASQYSPFNENAKYPPVILDRSGKSYGYFTVNKRFPGRTLNNMTEYICKWRDEIIEDIPGHYETIYGTKYKKR